MQKDQMTLTRNHTRLIGILVLILSAHSYVPLLAKSVIPVAETTAATATVKETATDSQEFTRWGYGNEFLGAAHFWSFIGTYRFSEHWGVTGGFSYILIPGLTYNADFFIVPITASYFIGGFGHGIELQAGTLIVAPAEMGYRTADRTGHRASATSEWLVAITGIGYSYRPRGEGWFFRVSVYGVIGRDPKPNEWGIRPWPGISAGRVF